MPRQKGFDISPLFEILATEVAKTIREELQQRWDTIDQRLNRIEMAIKTSGSTGGAKIGRLPKSCAVDGCERPVRAKGLCGAHYQQLRYRQSKEAEGKQVRPRQDVDIPSNEAEHENDNTVIAPVRMIIRKKNQQTEEASPSIMNNPNSSSKNFNSTTIDKPATKNEPQAIHPSLRPII